MAITTKLVGVESLLAKLRAYATNAPLRVQAAVTASLEQMETDAKALAPVDSGQLRDSIHANPSGRLAGSVTVGVDYAKWVELGSGRNAPQPFLYPAYHRNKTAFLASLKQALKFRP
ncbi:HK97 gp10 family phage protein [Hymenobacter sp. M29]|uniref:HK97 gp10 family phage protein n=1 Tax=Hymenobacter mellowenesis TaxID=3063995 RepID=A0ABT9ADF8_9BACT|nr:HK97-gp10 family putative phage morphogenesis protein [Hymenobacter sp. M29]MDO7847457.1 HK97 gp10 family phage protein [Hymenobacter sp. M29]